MNTAPSLWVDISRWLLTTPPDRPVWQVAWCDLIHPEGLWHLWATYTSLHLPKKPRLQIIAWLACADSPYLHGEINAEIADCARRWQTCLPTHPPRGVSLWSLADDVDLILIRERTVSIPLSSIDVVITTTPDLSPAQQQISRHAHANTRWLALGEVPNHPAWQVSTPQQWHPWLHGLLCPPRYLRPAAITPARGKRSALVIGAGVAGCHLASALGRRGWQVSLIEQHTSYAQAASGNRAGAFYPLLSRQDNPTSRFTRAALAYAQTRWQRLPGDAWGQIGVLQVAKDAADAQRQQLLSAHADASDAVMWLSAAEIHARWGIIAPNGGCWFAQGGWVIPAATCAMALAQHPPRRYWQRAVARLYHQDHQWYALDCNNEVIAHASVLIMANGVHAACAPWQSALPLQAVHGQVSLFSNAALASATLPTAGLTTVLCQEGYALPLADAQFLVGASYDHSAIAQLSAQADADNWQRLRALLTTLPATPAPILTARTATRAVTNDKLPLVGHIPQGFDRFGHTQVWENAYVCAGLGSRGLAWAPLLAEVLAQGIDGGTLPLESDVWHALRAERALQRTWRRNHPGAR